MPGGGHVREIQTEIGHRSDHDDDRLRLHHLAAILEHCAIALQGLLQMSRLVGVAEPRPGHQVSGGSHRCCGVQLQERQPFDHRQQVAWPICVEQLRSDRDPASLVSGQSVHVGQWRVPTRSVGENVAAELHEERVIVTLVGIL